MCSSNVFEECPFFSTTRGEVFFRIKLGHGPVRSFLLIRHVQEGNRLIPSLFGRLSTLLCSRITFNAAMKASFGTHDFPLFCHTQAATSAGRI